MLGQVAQEHIPQARMDEIAQRFGALGIGQMPVSAADAVLQVLGVGAVAQHLQVVIGLDDHRIRLPGESHRLRYHAADIRHDHEPVPIQQQRIAIGKRSIVRHLEILHPDAPGHDLVPARLQRSAAGAVILPRDEMMRQRPRQVGRRPDRLAQVLAIRAQRTDMVVVVVRDQQPGEVIETQSLARQFLLQPPRTEAGVDQHPRLAGVHFIEYAQEIAVAAAAGGEGLEFN